MLTQLTKYLDKIIHYYYRFILFYYNKMYLSGLTLEGHRRYKVARKYFQRVPKYFYFFILGLLKYYLINHFWKKNSKLIGDKLHLKEY